MVGDLFMKQAAEIICIGSELLLGQITNTNARFLATALAELGIPHYFQTVVGDNIDRIHEVLAIATQRSGVILFTGGLGPTADDLTHEALASYFQVPLQEDAHLRTELEEKFQTRNRTLTPSQYKQCQLPEGAEVLPNPWGTAVGLVWEAQPGLHLLTFPGVPSEMHAMWQATAVPYLTSLGFGSTVFVSETLRFWGVGEGALAEKCAHLLASRNPTVAPYASRGEVHLRVTCAAPDETSARSQMAPVIAEILQIAGEDYFGGTDATLPLVVAEKLIKAHQTVAVAESCTGGLLGQLLTSPAGSSRYFIGGVVAYSNAVKIDYVGVDPVVMEQQGAVSKEVALQLATGIRKRLGSDWGIGITGISGPTGGTPLKPVGLIHLAIVGPDTMIHHEYRFGSNRERELVRWLSAHYALDLLRRALP
jgi:nicotinamide-nucleotide amidase